MTRLARIAVPRRMTTAITAIAVAIGAQSPALADQRAIDAAHSTITLHVLKSGFFKAFADNHVVQAPLAEGTLDDGPAPQVRFVIDAGRLRVMDPGISADEREQVQTRMLGPDVLDVQRFPQIRFQSTDIERAGSGDWVVRGQLTLHGQTQQVLVKVTSGQDRYRATASLKQTDFGITPISIAGGAVTVKNEVQVDSEIVVSPAAGATP